LNAGLVEEGIHLKDLGDCRNQLSWLVAQKERSTKYNIKSLSSSNKAKKKEEMKQADRGNKLMTKWYRRFDVRPTLARSPSCQYNFPSKRSEFVLRQKVQKRSPDLF
jgi:hypothetical protein